MYGACAPCTNIKDEASCHRDEKVSAEVLGLSECRWTGSERKALSDETAIPYSGRDDPHNSGIALTV